MIRLFKADEGHVVFTTIDHLMLKECTNICKGFGETQKFVNLKQLMQYQLLGFELVHCVHSPFNL